MKKGDIITPLTEQAIGLLGSTAIIPEDDKYIQSQDVAKIICNEDLLYPMFAYYLISSETVKKQLSAAAQQTKIRHTSPDKIKDCVVWIPDLKEQKHIASILSNLDKKITLNRAINQNLRARREQRENLFSLCRADAVNGDVSRNLEATPDRSSGAEAVRRAA
jgi:type I restriction enzyme S subunit